MHDTPLRGGDPRDASVTLPGGAQYAPNRRGHESLVGNGALSATHTPDRRPEIRFVVNRDLSARAHLESMDPDSRFQPSDRPSEADRRGNHLWIRGSAGANRPRKGP